MTALDRTWEAALDMGVVFNKPSMKQVDLPPDITVLSSEQLAEKFSALTAWADYAASKHSMAIIEERAAQRRLDFAENKMLITRMGAAVKGERITYVKAEISIHPDIVQLADEYEAAYATRKLMEMTLHNFERDLTLVSREITRRTSDQRAWRRDYNGA